MSGQDRRMPTDTELAELSTDELVQLGSELDDVTVLRNHDRWPVKGTAAEKRAERAVAGWFLLSALSALAFFISYIWWPWEYKAPGEDGDTMYRLYTPVIGATFGLAIVALGIGVVSYAKKFLPQDLAVQQRHDGPSSEVDRRTAAARLVQVGTTSGIARRSLIKRSAGLAAGLFGAGLGVAALGGLIKNPWKGGDNAALWTTGWTPVNGEKVYLRRDTGHSDDIVLLRPEDLDAGAMETVFPFRESDRGDHEKLLNALRRSDNPVMLIRLRPNTPVIKRKGQEDFNYGDYFAYSKVCSHVGCPTSLYEAQTNRILCPCHQSQFQANEYAKPVFGPATRALAQLPITVDEDGYFIAKGNFIEPVGPAFWERKS